MPATLTAATTAPQSAAEKPRLVSLDALRGFDMFWIMGADHLVRSLQKIYDCPLTRTLNEQMEHVEFEGFHFYDLIFPLFVFMVGIAITYSVPRMVDKQGVAAAVRRIVIRSLLLFVLGVLYMGGVSNGFKNIYTAGVLHRIASAYLFGALIFCFCRNVRMLICISVVLLAGYWALMTFVPVPGLVPRGGPPGFAPAFSLDFSHFAAPSYGKGKSLAYVIDQCFMPGQKFEGTIVSTLAAVANVLLGVLAGMFIQNDKVAPVRKAALLVLSGVSSVLLGFVWGMQFPIVKILWTSSYVLVACGYSAILLGVFYYVIDVAGCKRWAEPFVWVGMNAITIYLVSAAVGFQKLANRFVGGDIAVALGGWGDFVRAAVALVMVFAVCRFLYRRKIFLRL